MLTERQRSIIELKKVLKDRGMHTGDRRVYWLARTSSDGELYREYYLSSGQRARRIQELLTPGEARKPRRGISP